MIHVTPIEKLDMVLKTLQQYGRYINEIDLANEVKLIYNISLEHEEMRRILPKLAQDGYIIFIGQGTAIISYDGFLFHGYIEQKRLDDLKNANIMQNEMRIVRNELWLLRGTWAAAIVGSMVLAFQVLQYYFPHYSDYPYHWIWETIPKKGKY